jgi:hypothetical protein
MPGMFNRTNFAGASVIGTGSISVLAGFGFTNNSLTAPATPRGGPLATWTAGSIDPRNRINYLLPNIDTYVVIGANDTAFIDNDNNGVFSEGDASVSLVDTGGQLQLVGIDTAIPSPNQNISIRFVDANLSAPLDLRGFDELDRITIDLSTSRWMNAAGLVGLTPQSPTGAFNITSSSVPGTTISAQTIFSNGIGINRLNTNAGLGTIFALRAYQEYITSSTTGGIIRYLSNSINVNSIVASILTVSNTTIPLNSSRYLAKLPNSSRTINGTIIAPGPFIDYILPTI